MRHSPRRPMRYSPTLTNPFVAPPKPPHRNGKLCFACKSEVVDHPADVLCRECLRDWKDVG